MTTSLEPWVAIESTDLIGANRKLAVTGVVETTNSNQTPVLTEAESPSINSALLILDLTVTATGLGATVTGLSPVAFSKPCGEGQYKQVQIRGAGVDVTVDVQVVHS